MNYSTAIFLVRKDIRAVTVSYEVDTDGKGIKPFVAYKTPDPDLAVGAYVVIPTDTRHGMTVARVEEVDVDLDVDFTAQVKWLVGQVDRSFYDSLIEAENDVIAKIKSAEKRRRQEELAEKILADNPDLRELGAMDIPSLPAPAA